MDAKHWSDAIASFDGAKNLATDPAVRIRLDLETIVSMEALGKKPEASALALSAASGLPPGPQKDLFTQFETGPSPTPPVEPIALTGPVPEASPAATLPPATPAGTPEPASTPPPPPLIPELRP